MRKVRFLVTVMGIPHVGGTEFTAQADTVGMITDEAFAILRWKRTFDNNPWIVDLGVRQDSSGQRGGTGSVDFISGDDSNDYRELETSVKRG